MTRHTVKFLYNCRKCLYSEKSYRHLIFEETDYKKILGETEFETIRKIWKIGGFDYIICPTCESKNIMVYSLLINEDLKYKENDIKSCIDSKIGIYIKIEKFGNRFKNRINLSTNINNKDKKDLWAVNQFFNHIVNIINSRTNTAYERPYESSIAGSTDIMVLGNLDAHGLKTQINRFNTIGITKKEILKSLYSIGKELNIEYINDEIFDSLSTDPKYNRTDELESVEFKGAIMSEYFAYDPTEDTSKNFLKHKNYMCCKLGMKIIAFGIPDNEEPINFYNYKKESLFIINPDTNPIMLNHHFVYLAEELEDQLPT